MTDRKLIGSDGRKYDDFISYSFGEAHVKEQRERLKNIEKQNEELIELQKEKLEAERKLKESELRAIEFENDIQRAHDDNMRITRLFDDIGLSEKIYDKWFDKLSSDDEFIYEKELSNELSILSKLDSNYSFYNEEDILNEIELKNSDKKSDVEYAEIIEKIYKKSSKGAKKISKKNEELIEKYNNQFSIYLIAAIIVWVIFIIYTITYKGGDDYSAIYIAPIFVFLCFFTSFKTVIVYNKKKDLSNNINNESWLDDFNNSLNDYRRSYSSNINNKKEQLKQKHFIPELTKKIEDFYDFRRKHYLSKLEKLLLDLDFDSFVESNGIKYKTVNNSNKIKNGNIDDYIIYFEDHS